MKALQPNEKIYIKRALDDWMGGEVNISALHGFRWDRVSGGAGKTSGHISIYAYGDYDELKTIVACSGMHSDFHNDMKIVIPKQENVDRGYSAAYEKLARLADENQNLYAMYPEERRKLESAYMVILGLLGEKGEIKRIDLKQELQDTVEKNIFSKALKNLELTNDIEVIGNHWSNQVIRLA